MALSNIFREPRREITESLVGLVPLGLFLWADYRFGVYLYDVDPNRTPLPVPVGMLVGFLLFTLASVAVVGVLFATHALGDAICNRLQQVGLHLRPRQRYNGR